MSAPAAQVLYGDSSTPTLIARKPRQNRRRASTRSSLTFVSNDEYAFREGAIAPGYAGMEILSVDKIDLSGGVWELTLDCEGVLLGKDARRKKDGLRETDPIGDWDTYNDTWLSTNKTQFAKGQRAGQLLLHQRGAATAFLQRPVVGGSHGAVRGREGHPPAHKGGDLQWRCGE